MLLLFVCLFFIFVDFVAQSTEKCVQQLNICSPNNGSLDLTLAAGIQQTSSALQTSSGFFTLKKVDPPRETVE